MTYSAGRFAEMQNKNLGGFVPLIHVLRKFDGVFSTVFSLCLSCCLLLV